MNKLLSILLLLSLSFNWLLYKQLKELTAKDSPQTADIAHNTTTTFSPVQITGVKASTESNSELGIWLKQAQQAFEQRDFVAATSLYGDVFRLDEIQAETLLSNWIITIQTWLSQESWQPAQAFFEAFLHEYPFQLSALNLHAQLLQQQGKVMQAIEVYYQIHDNSIETEDKAKWLSRIHELIQSHFQLLVSSQRWQQLLTDAENLTYFEPEQGDYLMAAAMALIELNRLDEAKDYLNAVSQLPDYYTRAQQELAKIDKTQTGKKGIRLRKRGAHYVVRGHFESNASVNLMIDTGASLSVISQQAFDEISAYTTPTYLQHGTFNTAGGQVDAPVYSFERFRIGPYVVRNIEFVVMELENMNKANGLLGMNYLQLFNFQIDQANEQLLLEYR